MKDKIRNAYVYRHTKLGTNEVFYIGIGNRSKYSRAYDKYGRNKWWKAITNKYEYEVEILSHNLTWSEACEIEILLISYYKRQDCCGGTLVNLTDGGEGGFGFIKTEEQIDKWKKSNIGKQDGYKNVMFGKTRGKHHLAKEVLNLETGIFYDCALDACENLSISYSTFKNKLNGKITNNTSYIYVVDYEKSVLPYIKDKENQTRVINTITDTIYDTIKEAAKSIGMSSQTLSYKMRFSNDTDFQYLDKDFKTEKKRGWMKYILDTQTGVYYNSLKEASIYSDFTYGHLKQMLNPNSNNKNKTCLIYV